MKRIISTLLAFFMTLQLSSTAFAAQDTTSSQSVAREDNFTASDDMETSDLEVLEPEIPALEEVILPEDSDSETKTPETSSNPSNTTVEEAVSIPLPEGFTVPEDPDLTFDPEDTISYQDETGKEVIILQAINEKSSLVKLYIDGVLTQKSIGNYEDNIIYGEIYDREDGTETDLSEAEVVESNGFICIQIHKPVSDEVSNFVPSTNTLSTQSHSQTRSSTDDNPYGEPIENTGLTRTPYGDNYYTIETGGGYDYAPNTYGTISRKYTKKDIGLTKHWKFDAGMTIANVLSIIGTSGTPANAVVKLLVFTGKQVIAYLQAVELYTYQFNYNYKVRINSGGNNVYFAPTRILQYWQIYNQTTGKKGWNFDKEIGGFPLDNTEMIKQGIYNYTYYHFYDILDHWAAEDIRWAYNNGYMNGTSTYAFSPNATTTRAMAITTLYRMAGSPSSGTNSGFSDVPSSAYYAKAVTWGVKNKIVNGMDNSHFKPDQAVTREQFVVMLYNFAKHKGKNTSATANLNSFSDASSVSSWATRAMQWAVGKGIMQGNNGALKPKDNAKRAELTTLLRKFSQKA